MLWGFGNTDIPLQYRKYIVDKIKLFGYTFDKRGCAAMPENWEKMEQALENLKNNTPPSEISNRGRVKTIMTYTYPLLAYHSWGIMPTLEKIREIEKTFSDYVFSPLPRRVINIETLYLPAETGGINFPNIKYRIYSQRIAFIIWRHNSTDRTAVWHNLFDYFTQQAEMNLPAAKFYRDLKKAANELELTIFQHDNHWQARLGLQTKMIKNLNSSEVYKISTKRKFVNTLTVLERRWENIVPPLRDKLDIPKLATFLNLIWKTPALAAAKNFSYNMFNNKIYTRMVEAEYNSHVQSTTCVLCEAANETQLHLFTECEKVKPLWETISRIITSITNKIHTLTPDKILLGNFKEITISERKLISYVMINARWAIWYARYCKINNYHATTITETFKTLIKKDIKYANMGLTSEEKTKHFVLNHLGIGFLRNGTLHSII